MFVTALLWSWIYLGFGLCGGDLRMAYSACLIAGIFLWEGTFGRLLRPAFSGFWKFVRMRLRLIWLPCKKFLKKAGKIKNYLFASGKKWVTIKCKYHPLKQTKNRRTTHGNTHPQIRLVYHRSSLFLKILVLVTILASAAALLVMRSTMLGYRQQSQVLQSQAVALQRENAELTEHIEELGTDNSIRRIAREELGLMEPSAQFFNPGE